MHHNFVRQSYHHWGCFVLSPHKIRPPDTLYIGICSRYGVWLSFICILIFICPRVGTGFISVFDDFARSYAERILSYNSEFPRILEGFELGFVSRLGSHPLSVVYDISPNNESWIFITPCSHSNYTVTIQSFVSNNESRELNVSNSINEKPFENWYFKNRTLDMKYSSGLGEKIDISNWKRQEMHVRNLILGIMRLYIDKSDLLPAVYMIRQYSGLIDAFYPKIPPNPSVRVCVANELKLVVSVHVSRAYNADTYCASFNLVESLPNFCSAQLRMDQKWLENQKDYVNLKIRRPSVFDDYYRLRNISRIQDSQFRCFKTNSFEIVLNKNYRYSKIFINIFAVNSETKFTDSYKPVQYNWGQFNNDCESSEKKIDKYSSQIWIMGNETVTFNITNGIYPYRLLYQSCVDNSKNRKQSLHVFQKESQTPICVEIVHPRLTALCTKLKPGTYRLQHSVNFRPRRTIPVGQLYYLPDNSRIFPHLYCNRTIEFHISVNLTALNNSKTKYKISIKFSRIPSPLAITYYFHIIDFRITNEGKLNNADFMTNFEKMISNEMNFCKFVHNQYVKRPVHRTTLKGLRCSNVTQENTAIPGIFDGNYVYGIFVYFSPASDWRQDYVQFYSKRIFTISPEEDVT